MIIADRDASVMATGRDKQRAWRLNAYEGRGTSGGDPCELCATVLHLKKGSVRLGDFGDQERESKDEILAESTVSVEARPAARWWRALQSNLSLGTCLHLTPTSLTATTGCFRSLGAT